MSTDYGFTEGDCKLIKTQIERRAHFRRVFLKLRTDPCKHSKESGYVFDEAVQRFLSMKATQFDHFQVNQRTILFGVCAIILPMSIYGYVIWTHRQNWLNEIATGKLTYKDRLFKFQ